MVGSSKNTMSGSPIRAKATSRRRRWPPESCPARRRPCRSSRPGRWCRRRRAAPGNSPRRAPSTPAPTSRARAPIPAGRPPPGRARPRRRGRIDAQHADLAVGALPEPLQDLDGGRLAGTVGTQEGEDLAAVHLQVDTADRFAAPVTLDQPAHHHNQISVNPRCCRHVRISSPVSRAQVVPRIPRCRPQVEHQPLAHTRTGLYSLRRQLQ